MKNLYLIFSVFVLFMVKGDTPEVYWPALVSSGPSWLLEELSPIEAAVGNMPVTEGNDYFVCTGMSRCSNHDPYSRQAAAVSPDGENGIIYLLFTTP